MPPGTVRKEKLTKAEVEKLVAEKKNYLAPDDKPVRNVTVSTDRHLKTSEAETMLKRIADDPGWRITTNVDTGIVGVINYDTARKSRSGKAVQASSVPPYVHAAAMANLKTLFRNAALGVIHRNWYEKNQILNGDKIRAMARFYVGMRYEGEQYGVKITAKFMESGRNNLYSIEAHDIEVFPETTEKKPPQSPGEARTASFPDSLRSVPFPDITERGGQQLSQKENLLQNSIQSNAFTEKIKSQTEKKAELTSEFGGEQRYRFR